MGLIYPRQSSFMGLVYHCRVSWASWIPAEFHEPRVPLPRDAPNGGSSITSQLQFHFLFTFSKHTIVIIHFIKTCSFTHTMYQHVFLTHSHNEFPTLINLTTKCSFSKPFVWQWEGRLDYECSMQNGATRAKQVQRKEPEPKQNMRGKTVKTVHMGPQPSGREFQQLMVQTDFLHIFPKMEFQPKTQLWGLKSEFQGTNKPIFMNKGEGRCIN